MNQANQNNSSHSNNELGLTSNHFWLLVPFAIGLLISLLSPGDVMKYVIPREIVDIVGVVIPMVRKIKGEYELSQIAQFYYAVIWIITPIFSLLAFKAKHPIEKNEDNLDIGVFVIAIFLSFCLRYLFFEGLDPNDTGSKYAVLLHSRLGMGIFGILIPIFAFITVVVDLAVIAGFLSYLNKGKEE
ncbi:hypothetical protein PL263_13860 [Methylomonas sp. EFPC3]|uniref:hypothetical protein n=1 Tax=Methylomonas sp. EFPC3 TaxID=3021710 RepID=UPI002416B79A|nr:hypothetical protein [Methylomonas sp. EFPC3]WFP49180.1 hypothetical protein PL263_13860 [Methylomonas sp. EFPC3]